MGCKGRVRGKLTALRQRARWGGGGTREQHGVPRMGSALMALSTDSSSWAFHACRCSCHTPSPAVVMGNKTTSAVTSGCRVLMDACGWHGRE